MRSSVTGLCICFTLLFSGTHAFLWEYGLASPDSVTVQEISGQFQLFEFTKVINLLVPFCYDVSYVRVSTTGGLTPPAVSYNKAAQTITIGYGLLRGILPTYEVVVKAEYKCYEEPPCSFGKC